MVDPRQLMDDDDDTAFSASEIPTKVGRFLQIAPVFAGVIQVFIYPSGPVDASQLRQLAKDANTAADILDAEEAKLKAQYAQSGGTS